MMKKISRRSFLQVCGITAATAALTACGSGKAEGDKSSSQNGKIQITFYLWDRSMMKALTPWLEEKFPEYEFNFIQGFNTMDYYRDLLNRAEQLPDIITCRRFSLNESLQSISSQRNSELSRFFMQNIARRSKST